MDESRPCDALEHLLDSRGGQAPCRCKAHLEVQSLSLLRDQPVTLKVTRSDAVGAVDVLSAQGDLPETQAISISTDTELLLDTMLQPDNDRAIPATGFGKCPNQP